jgi:hypothetical protein
MDAFSLCFGILDQSIVLNMRGQPAFLAGPVTIQAGRGSRRPKDKIAVGLIAMPPPSATTSPENGCSVFDAA